MIKAPANHPVFSGSVDEITDWNEWLKKWEEAMTLEEKLGLLHVGFSVKAFGFYEKQLAFYLALADGWNTYDFRLDQDPRDAYDLGFRRQGLAKKAFAVVVLKVLNRYLGDSSNSGNRSALLKEDSAKVLLDFFNPRRFALGKASNIPNATWHEGRVAIEFLKDYTETLWYLGRPRHREYLWVRPLHRLLLHIMLELGNVDPILKYYESVTQTDIRWLEQQALRGRQSLAEAYFTAEGTERRIIEIVILIRVKRGELAKQKRLERAETKKRRKREKQWKWEEAARKLREAEQEFTRVKGDSQ